MKSGAPRLRMGKHNMTKGAFLPEELAVRVGSRGTFLSIADWVFQVMEFHAQLQKNMQKRSWIHRVIVLSGVQFGTLWSYTHRE